MKKIILALFFTSFFAVADTGVSKEEVEELIEVASGHVTEIDINGFAVSGTSINTTSNKELRNCAQALGSQLVADVYLKPAHEYGLYAELTNVRDGANTVGANMVINQLLGISGSDEVALTICNKLRSNM
ncbi:hypothetical protein PQC06_gp103 [Aeromonas phage LAh10]|uniref:Uncharacterized protein n=1 Tax=Aeromonas phage LAh10 TaxID=2591025 RepID=A0A514A1Q4_9CAUD|nr:hypothetical protein PQC06_gp103 [Aeromonas phage LAh10]QDH47203.1 hypothetical protein LAh10_103 [Aeromonas phage LAh10]